MQYKEKEFSYNFNVYVKSCIKKNVTNTLHFLFYAYYCLGINKKEILRLI